jgi:hypothetical protein
MCCCILFENTFGAKNNWENHQFSKCWGTSVFIGNKGNNKDRRVYNQMVSAYLRMSCVPLCLYGLCLPSVYCTICAAFMVAKHVNDNNELHNQIQSAARGGNRDHGHCTCCSVMFCLAMENKPGDEDIVCVQGGAVNNNNNIVINQPAQAPGTSANDIMFMQQMNFNNMMQANMMQQPQTLRQPLVPQTATTENPMMISVAASPVIYKEISPPSTAPPTQQGYYH